MAAPDTRYAKHGDAHLAYQVLGEGPIALLAFTNGSNVWIDRDAEPHWTRFDERLASFTRLIRFDPLGIGLSDPLRDGAQLSAEGWTQDALAVLDAAGSSRAALLGTSTAGLAAILLAATHPERVSALVLVHAFARVVRDDDYPCGVPRHVFERFLDEVTDPAHGGDTIDDLALSTRTLAKDPEFRAWWKRAGQRSASPAVARAMNAVALVTDLRPVLASIAVPTLVVHRVDNPFIRVGHGRFLAERIPGARLLELPGDDHLPYTGDTDALLGEIEEFLTG